MTFILLLLLLLAVAFFFKGWINRYSWFFLMLTFALISTIYSVLLLISANGIYQPLGLINSFDDRVFRLIVGTRLSFFKITRIFNCSVSMYISALSLFVLSYFSYKYFSIDKDKIIKLLVFAVFPVFYMWFYDPQTTYWFYQKILSGDISYRFICLIDLLNYILLFIYMFEPIVYIMLKYKKIVSFYKKRQIAGVAIYAFSLNIIFILIFKVGIVQNFYFGSSPSGLIQIKRVLTMSTSEYNAVLTIMLFVIIVMFFAMFKFDVAPKMGFISRFIFARNIQHLNKNFINIFHSVKKTMFLYKIMAERAIREDEKASKETISGLVSQIDDYIRNITRMLDVNNDIEVFVEKVNLNEILENCISRYSVDEGITYSLNFVNDCIVVEADSFYLEDVFDNIIKNGNEAIKRKKESGTVTVDVDTEHEWVVVKISDDGEGIQKQNLKNIFKPLFTTKSRTNNWGIGLSFVYKIIKMHMGHIYVESTVGKGTTVNVLLPRRG